MTKSVGDTRLKVIVGGSVRTAWSGLLDLSGIIDPGSSGGGGGGGGTPGYAVSGDSSFGANGTYCEAGTYNGKPYYTYSTWYLYWGTELFMSYSGWVISDGDTYDNETLWYWYSNDTGSTPPASMDGYMGGGVDTLTLTATTCP